MRKIGLFEAKQKLSELVELASQGELVGITRRGKLAAVLTAPQVADGFLTAARRGVLSSGAAKIALESLYQLLGASIETADAFTPLGQIHDFARPLHLSAYDAVYLNFARVQNRPLATLDKSLIRAAQDTGVELFG